LGFNFGLSMFTSDDYCRMVAIDLLYACLLDNEALVGIPEEQ
jgi:hypothetical protein